MVGIPNVLNLAFSEFSSPLFHVEDLKQALLFKKWGNKNPQQNPTETIQAPTPSVPQLRE